MSATKITVSGLVALHVAAGWLLSLAAQRSLGYFSLPLLALLALTFADACLLGVWAGLSRARLLWRAGVLAVALPYLWTLYAIAFWVPCERGVQFAMIVQPSVAIALLLDTLQSVRGLRCAYLPLTQPATHRLQFSIRHALLATAVLALVLGIWRVADFAILDDELGSIGERTIPLCAMLTTLAALWAALGVQSPNSRLFGVLLLAGVAPAALLAGRIPVWFFTFNATTTTDSVLVLTVYGMQAAVVGVTLLAMRRCGWRLVSTLPRETSLPSVQQSLIGHAEVASLNFAVRDCAGES